MAALAQNLSENTQRSRFRALEDIEALRRQRLLRLAREKARSDWQATLAYHRQGRGRVRKMMFCEVPGMRGGGVWV